IHPNDTFRIIRALEVFYITGQPISQHHQRHAFRESYYEALSVGIQRERSDLYERINKRCEQMIKTGFIDEVKSLLERGYHSGLRSMRSLGYRHLCAYIEGKISWEETIKTMKHDTRQFARRQLIWFQADKKIIWLEDPLQNLNSVKNLILNFLEK
ncbi:MAG: tRNA (adenosine(37)-N6)-dimethylallyltransferase MiaA, partial [Desulfobacterota bacterium]|nr:tRNA (adenosine(37)-N6)-dimethylallyltransferase MiaA [Thermodesulfobacteriota bacterium]